MIVLSSIPWTSLIEWGSNPLDSFFVARILLISTQTRRSTQKSSSRISNLWNKETLKKGFHLSIGKSFVLQNITLQAWLRAVFDWVSKSNWFWITMLHDWLKELGPIFCPIRSKTRTNRDFPAQVFPRFAPETCKYFSFDWVTGWPVSFVIGPTG